MVERGGWRPSWGPPGALPGLRRVPTPRPPRLPRLAGLPGLPGLPSTRRGHEYVYACGGRQPSEGGGAPRGSGPLWGRLTAGEASPGGGGARRLLRPRPGGDGQGLDDWGCYEESESK